MKHDLMGVFSALANFHPLIDQIRVEYLENKAEVFIDFTENTKANSLEAWVITGYIGKLLSPRFEKITYGRTNTTTNTAILTLVQ